MAGWAGAPFSGISQQDAFFDREPGWGGNSNSNCHSHIDTHSYTENNCDTEGSTYMGPAF